MADLVGEDRQHCQAWQSRDGSGWTFPVLRESLHVDERREPPARAEVRSPVSDLAHRFPRCRSAPGRRGPGRTWALLASWSDRVEYNQGVVGVFVRSEGTCGQSRTRPARFRPQRSRLGSAHPRSDLIAVRSSRLPRPSETRPRGKCRRRRPASRAYRSETRSSRSACRTIRNVWRFPIPKSLNSGTSSQVTSARLPWLRNRTFPPLLGSRSRKSGAILGGPPAAREKLRSNQLGSGATNVKLPSECTNPKVYSFP